MSDGVYSADPKINKDAVKYEHLTHIQMLQEGLRVMDSTASSFCMDNNIPLTVSLLWKKEILNVLLWVKDRYVNYKINLEV